jgi:hypothetical protein
MAIPEKSFSPPAEDALDDDRHPLSQFGLSDVPF